MDSLALWSSTVWLTICVRFTFWEDSDAEGAQIFILTPQVMREDVPTKFPDRCGQLRHPQSEVLAAG